MHISFQSLPGRRSVQSEALRETHHHSCVGSGERGAGGGQDAAVRTTVWCSPEENATPSERGLSEQGRGQASAAVLTVVGPWRLPRARRRAEGCGGVSKPVLFGTAPAPVT